MTRSGGRGGRTARAGPTWTMSRPSTRTEPSVRIRRPGSSVMTVACSTRITPRSSEQLEGRELDGAREARAARDGDDPVQPAEILRAGLESQHGPEVVLRGVDDL